MSAIPSGTLNNYVAMPLLGFGVFQTPPDVTTATVEEALRPGFAQISTVAQKLQSLHINYERLQAEAAQVAKPLHCSGGQ